jgi:hypothetical protein
MTTRQNAERRAAARNRHYAANGAELVQQVEGKHRAEGGVVVDQQPG